MSSCYILQFNSMEHYQINIILWYKNLRLYILFRRSGVTLTAHINTEIYNIHVFIYDFKLYWYYSFRNIHTSSLWHWMMESSDGSWREEKANGKDDDKVMVLTPMSHPVGERLTLPPNARQSIWSNMIANWFS